MIEKIHVPGLSEAISKRGVPLTVATKAKGFVFVSGLPPINPADGSMQQGDITVQLRQAMSNLKLALEHADSSLENCLMVTLYVANAGFFGAINKTYAQYFSALPPARTCIAVGSWPFEADLEVEAIAVVNN